MLDVGGATPAIFDLHNRGTNTSALTMLLRPAPELTGVAASPLYVLNVNAAVPNTGTLAHPVIRAYAVATQVRRQTVPLVRNDRASTAVVLDVANAGTLLAVTDGGAAAPPPPDTRYATGDVIRVTTAAGDVAYHSLTANVAPLDARPVSLTVPLARAHAAGSPVAERARLLTVQALDAGAWGNRLRVSVEDEAPGLVARTTLTQSGPATRIRLASSAGVEPGTILEPLDPATDTPVGDPLKVIAVDRSTNDVTLDPGLSGAQQAAIGALPPGAFMGVRSRGFRLSVYLLRQPDPAMPSRNETILDTEVFRIRDFRPNNRGIRVFGGRVITSDPDWKYVNVRRLLIFIEHSIDRGLQWVVFEPNAEPLWARVRRSISNFLTLVWRNGGLEGTKVEEAYFAKCDRTTMTQTDIDGGRLIVIVGVAPVKPAEFVIIRIGLGTARAEN